MSAKDYVLQGVSTPITTSIGNHVWAFDLGKGSEGEAVRQGTHFPHVESLLIPAELARRGPASLSGTPANKYRALKTREAHHARERWLETVWTAAGFMPLRGRQMMKVGAFCPWPRRRNKKGRPVGKAARAGHWECVEEGDRRLEQEFAKDGDTTCYTSCLLRIKLLTWKPGDPKLADWQIYKALRAALQTRGYGPVPWARKEVQREKQTKEVEAKEIETATRWAEFKQSVSPKFRFPCYYDAAKMGLWNPAAPNAPAPQNSHLANSTRNVRFDRTDVEREIKQLAENADRLLEGRLSTAKQKLVQEFMEGRRKRVREINERRALKNSVLPPEKRKQPRKEPPFQHISTSVADFLCYGPSGVSCASYDRSLQADMALRAGSAHDWQGVLGQKVPRFDNRILNNCVLIPRFHVCKVDVRMAEKDDDKKGIKAGQVLPDSLLATEVTFLLKLKNIRVMPNVRPLTAEQIAKLLAQKRQEAAKLVLNPSDPKCGENVTNVYSFGKREWSEVGKRDGFNFRPAPNHEKVEAPKSGGRSRFSRPALRLMRALVLSGERPSVFRQRLIDRDAATLALLELPANKPFLLHKNCTEPGLTDDQKRKQDERLGREGLLESDLDFLLKMRKADTKEDSWEDLFIPNQKLDGLVLRLQAETDSAKQRQQRTQAITDLIGEQNDPIVRHRLNFFWKRLQALEREYGEPARIILEFAREDFLGKEAKKQWQDFNKTKREQNASVRALATNERDQLKIKLWQDQGGECVYGQPVSKDGHCLYTQKGLPQPGMPGWDTLEIDHIVPKAEGGPDAYINYVLTFGEVANGAKSKLTPYDWFSRDRKGELDGYIRFVQSKGAKLGRKKVALLTEPNAKDLVQRYTALAETAWVSRLAQTIVRLHFGWPLDNQKGEERVLTLTGGQTAQFRREFRLNSLLGPNAKLTTSVSDISKQEEEDIANQIQSDLLDDKKKNRVDPRHHALDAMALTLIPEWRHYQTKKWEFWRTRRAGEEPRKEVMERPTPFFDAHFETREGKRFLDHNGIRLQFRESLAKVHAELVAFERPQLEATHYAKQRVEAQVNKPLDEIACVHPADPQHREFDNHKLKRWLKHCVREDQKAALAGFCDSTPTAENWEQFKAANKKLFRSGQVKVLLPEHLSPRIAYTVRKELRLLAYANNPQASETIFKPEHARQDAERIDTSTPGMSDLKVAMAAYLAEQPTPEEGTFTNWLTEQCRGLPGGKIRLLPLADKREEPDSKRRAESSDAKGFGRRRIPLKFERKRLIKKYGDICDPFIREAIAKAFDIRGAGKAATAREFTREEWEAFCSELRHPAKKPGVIGPSVLKVTMLAGDAAEEDEADSDANATEAYEASEESGAPASRDEFLPSSKSHRAYLKGKAHKGYYLYLDEDGKPQRWPIYAHEGTRAGRASFEREQERLQGLPDSKFRLIGLLRTGCRVQLESDAKKGDKVIAPQGIYRLNTMNVNGRTKLTSQSGTPIIAQIEVFLAAGFQIVRREKGR